MFLLPISSFNVAIFLSFSITHYCHIKNQINSSGKCASISLLFQKMLLFDIKIFLVSSPCYHFNKITRLCYKSAFEIFILNKIWMKLIGQKLLRKCLCLLGTISLFSLFINQTIYQNWYIWMLNMFFYHLYDVILLYLHLLPVLYFLKYLHLFQ